MKAEREATSKAKIISQILLLVYLGSFNSGRSRFSSLDFALGFADINRSHSFA